MTDEAFSVEVPGSGSVSAIASPAEGGSATGLTFVYAPGAGSSIRDAFGAFLASRLPALGVSVWRFQFLYMEGKRGGPDRPPVLEATWRAVLAEARRRGAGRLVIGGRSMGGRIASQVVAAGEDVAGLALFAYPLHPPGKPEQRRDTHLASIRVPTQFVCGTRDTFGTPEELASAVALVPEAKLHLLDGADHGFKVLKASGRGEKDIWEEALSVLVEFIGKV
jgi:predicted alpha/beta-hydrolase family hydrolase